MDVMVRPMQTGKITLNNQSLKKQNGFTYIGVLVIITVVMIGAAAVGQVWHTMMQREKEQELLFVGNQFRTAIAQFYMSTGGQYPMSLDGLLGATGQQQGSGKRFLRRIYLDPITGSQEWGLIRQGGGGVYGVYSLSDEKPLKVSGFSEANKLFEGKTKYSEWRFIYTPPVQAPVGNSVVNGIARPLPRPK